MKAKRIVPAAAAVAVAAVAAIVLSQRGPGGGLLASGTVEATEARLGFQMSGLLERVSVREGDRVAAGQELANLVRVEAEARRAQAAAQVASARAMLEEMERGSRPEEIAQARAGRAAARQKLADAERDADRTRRLFDGGAVSREALDKAVLALDVAGSQAEQAQEQLRLVERGPRSERIEAQRALLAQAEALVQAADAVIANMTVRAPFDGVVTARHREPGEIVPAGGVVLSVMNPDDRWVRIYVPENRLGAVRIGQKAAVRSDTDPAKRYAGEVVHVASEAEFTPKTVQTTEERVKLVYAVKVRVTGDPGGELKPGMPADVLLVSGGS